jgi:flavin reductase (DIM6/NTAB) family NADH-FMN oxidoreductase RutF
VTIAQQSDHQPAPTLRHALRHLAGGVCIVTVGEGPTRTGFTATSVTSLTLDPPCILVCINRKASAWPLIRSERRFCVNILADRHRSLAVRFSGASGLKGQQRYGEGTWLTGSHGTPVLADALAAIECDLEDAIERHSHLILIGDVRSLRVESEGAPLLYVQGQYGRLTEF